MSTPTPAQPSMTVMVRAAGHDLDGMGPPGDGHYYIVLEVPNDQNDDMLLHALVSGRIQVSGAPR